MFALVSILDHVIQRSLGANIVLDKWIFSICGDGCPLQGLTVIIQTWFVDNASSREIEACLVNFPTVFQYGKLYFPFGLRMYIIMDLLFLICLTIFVSL